MARGKLFVNYDIMLVKNIVRRAGIGRCYYKKYVNPDNNRPYWSHQCKGDTTMFKSAFGGEAAELCKHHFREVMDIELHLIKSSSEYIRKHKITIPEQTQKLLL